MTGRRANQLRYGALGKAFSRSYPQRDSNPAQAAAGPQDDGDPGILNRTLAASQQELGYVED